MGMVEGDMKMVNVHYLTVLQHEWVQGGRCQRTIRFKKGFPPELNFPQHGTKGGRGDRFHQRITYAASVPGTVDALESLELFGTLGTYGDEEGGPQLLREESSTSKPDLDTLIMKTGSESIEATSRRRRILFAGFVARMGNTRLPKCVMFRELVGGVGCVAVQEKNLMGCFPDDLRAFGINANEWTI